MKNINISNKIYWKFWKFWKKSKFIYKKINETDHKIYDN